jgi:hypothetical protein
VYDFSGVKILAREVSARGGPIARHFALAAGSKGKRFLLNVEKSRRSVNR